MKKLGVWLLLGLFIFVQQASAVSQTASAQFGQLPISFIPNTDSESLYQFQATGVSGTLSFTSTSIRINLPHPSLNTNLVPVELQFENANAQTTITGNEILPGRVNYFTGADSTTWRSDVPTYGSITYNHLYPGIDLLYNGVEGKLKSTYNVAPGVDPGNIRWHYNGSQEVQLNEITGDLLIYIKDDYILTEHAPIAWQDIGGERVPVEIGYVIDEHNTIAFDVGMYDPAYVLIIDPILVYSSFLSSTESTGTAIKVDGDGNIYIAGYVNYPPPGFYFPLVNPLQSQHGGATCGSNNLPCPDIFVTKLNPEGNQILFSTYIGGLAHDIAQAMAVDADGNVYIGGITRSLNFPTQNALYPSMHGTTCADISCWDDAFILKLSATGNSLIFSTYLGGALTDNLESMTIDGAGNVYASGYTYSTDFPTANALFPTMNGNTDIFLIKLDASGTSISFSTFLGGSQNESHSEIALDSDEHIYMGGRTSSTNFPVTPATAYQPTYGGGQDAFIIKLNPSASSILYASYLGGVGSDSGRGIAVDSTGVYLTGQADSGFPTTLGAFDRTYAYNSGLEAFAAKFNTNASGAASLIYSTYMGGTGEEEVLDMIAPGDGTVYVVGRTTSSNLPLMNAIQSGAGKTSSDSDGFIFRLNPTGSALLFSSYLGGQQSTCDQFDRVVGIANDAVGSVYLTGYSRSSCFPTTPNAYLGAANGGGVFITKIASYTLDIEQTISDLTPDEGQTLSLTLNLTNRSTSSITNIRVQDSLPASLQFVSANSPNYNASTGIWTINSLGAGQSVSLVIQVQVKAGTSGTSFTNTAAVTQFSPSNVNAGFDSSTVTIQVGLDLAIQKVADRSFASSGDTITYTLIAQNQSASATATGVMVQDLLPSHLTYLSAETSQGSYDVQSGQWEVGDLEAGTNATLSIVTTINPVPNYTTVTNTASITGDQVDFVTANNTQSSMVSVSLCAPLNHIAHLTVPFDGSQVDYSNSVNASVSLNGELVAFESFASNLVSDDTNNLQDIFVYDRATCQTRLVSVAQNGQPANGYSTHAEISANGRYVAFRSSATNLVVGDSNGVADIFVRDLATNSTIRVSVASNGTQANNDSDYPTISADGRYIVYHSTATNLVNGDSNGYQDVFVYDRQTSTTTRVSTGLNGAQANNNSGDAVISADGHFIGFKSWANNLTVNDTNGKSDIFIYDQLTHTIVLGSVNSNGVQGNSDSYLATLSGDGHYLVFTSNANNFDSANPGNHDVYVRDLQTGITTRLSTASNGTIANAASNNPRISIDGRYVAFQSMASNLVNGDSGNGYDIFLKDLLTGQIIMVSANAEGIPGNSMSMLPYISSDGHYVVFTSGASNLVSYADGASPSPQENFLVESAFPANPISKTDLVVTQAGSSSVLLANDEVVFTVTITNSSDQDATDVTLRDLLPSSLTFSHTVAEALSCNQLGGVLYCAVGNIPAGQSITIELHVSINSGTIGLVTNEVMVLANELDSDSWTNVAQATIQVNAPPSNLLAAALAFNRVGLIWLDHSYHEDFFLVERSVDGINDWVEIDQTDPNITNYTDDTLICQSTYYYRVRAILSDGRNTDYSDTASVTTLTCPPLYAPYNVTADVVAFNQINLTWADVSADETDFRVERSTDGATYWTEIGNAAPTAITANYQDQNPVCETTYYYRVRAHRSSNNAYSVFSTIVQATTLTCPPLDAPTEVITAPSEAHISLVWIDNSIDETNFNIERSMDGINDWVLIAQTDANISEYDDTDVECETSYFYRVRAHRSSNNAYSDFSIIVQATTLTCPPLNIPEDVEVIPSASDQVDLTWSDTSVAETGYKIERTLDGHQNWTEIGQTRANITHFSDTQVSCSQAYDYRIRAYRNNGDYSDYALTDGISLICPPTNLEAASVSFVQVDLNWTDTSANEDSFIIERSSVDLDTWAVIGQTGANTSYFADTQVQCGETYSYRVRAYSSLDNSYSDYSNFVDYTTQACSNFSAAPSLNFQTSSSIVISWNRISWALEYEIEISNSPQFDGTVHQYIRVNNAQLNLALPSLPNGIYYWRVRARLDATRWGNWSTPEQFTLITSE